MNLSLNEDFSLFIHMLCLFCRPSLVFIRDVQDFLNHEHRVFNSEEFLRTREPADQSFYKKVHSHIHTFNYTDMHTYTHTHLTRLQSVLSVSLCCRSQVLDTHIFHSFLRDRLNRKRDTFSRMEQKTRNHAHRYDVINERRK